jgi:glutaconate CoA-transferase subunit A
VTRDKRTTIDDAVAELRDGMTIGIGGWGSRRKPMAIVRAILRSDLNDLTVVTFGGPEVGLLCAARKVRSVVFGFVTLDSVVLDPHFRAARQDGLVHAVELDEGMLQWGLRAAAMRVSFLPCRAGLGSSVLDLNPDLRTVVSPYDDGDEYVAMPAIHLDAAIVHANRCDPSGNAQYLGYDWYFDDLFCLAARHRIVSCEGVVATADLLREGGPHTLRLNRLLVDRVVEAPLGAHFTACPPDYGRDERAQRLYVEAAADEAAWARFRAGHVDLSEPEYRRKVASS